MPTLIKCKHAIQQYEIFSSQLVMEQVRNQDFYFEDQDFYFEVLSNIYQKFINISIHHYFFYNYINLPYNISTTLFYHQNFKNVKKN